MKTLKFALALSAMMLPAALAHAENVAVKFWAAWDPNATDGLAAKKMIAEYEKAHPGITIEIQNIAFGALHDKLITSVAAKDAPDISWGLAEWFGELYRMDALMDLSAFKKANPDMAQYYPNVIEALSVDGKLMALPHYLGVRALLYHQDQLAKAGVQPPATWDDLLTVGEKITKATGKPAFGIAGTGVRSPQELIAYLAQNDVEIAKRQPDGKFRNTWGDHPEEMARAAEVFAFYKSLVDKGVMAPEAASWGWEEEDTNFALGNYAMVIDGSWMKNQADAHPESMKDVRLAPPPKKLKAATFFEINPFYVFKGSKHPKETLDFAAYLLSKDYMKAVNPSRAPRVDVVTDDMWGKGFTDLVPIGVIFPSVALGQITKDMQDSIGRALLKKQDPTEVAKWLSTAINRDLKQSGELSGK